MLFKYILQSEASFFVLWYARLSARHRALPVVVGWRHLERCPGGSKDAGDLRGSQPDAGRSNVCTRQAVKLALLHAPPGTASGNTASTLKLSQINP